MVWALHIFRFRVEPSNGVCGKVQQCVMRLDAYIFVDGNISEFTTRREGDWIVIRCPAETL